MVRKTGRILNFSITPAASHIIHQPHHQRAPAGLIRRVIRQPNRLRRLRAAVKHRRAGIAVVRRAASDVRFVIWTHAGPKSVVRFPSVQATLLGTQLVAR